MRIVWDAVVRPSLDADVQLVITATDADIALLDRATQGVYPRDSLSELPDELLRAAFDCPDGSAPIVIDGVCSGCELLH